MMERGEGIYEEGQGPGMGVASSSPGQGGMVAISTHRGSGPVLRNWNRAPVGISKLTPGRKSKTSSLLPS